MSFGSLRSRPVSPLISGKGDCGVLHETTVLLVPFVPSMLRGITLGEDIARVCLFEGHHWHTVAHSSHNNNMGHWPFSVPPTVSVSCFLTIEKRVEGKGSRLRPAPSRYREPGPHPAALASDHKQTHGWCRGYRRAEFLRVAIGDHSRRSRLRKLLIGKTAPSAKTHKTSPPMPQNPPTRCRIAETDLQRS